VLVLDEADTLLDMGFKDTINQLLAVLPKQRRTGLFSATQTKEVRELARAGLRNPVSISVRVQSKGGAENQPGGAVSSVQQATPSTLDNSYMVCPHDQRPDELVTFLNAHQNNKIIVFCATCACVDYYSNVFEQIAKRGKLLPKTFEIVGFHGKMIPKKRNLLYKKFVGLSSGVMFSTDVAARGVDIPDVDWIVQLAAPRDPAFFVHRVGRTARAGKVGGALLFVTAEEQVLICLCVKFLVLRVLPMADQVHPLAISNYW
jgi:ATP-dependent RNA helicase DDX55/SPB4